MSYLRNAPSARRTPQSQPIPGSSQVANSAGGFSWKVDPLTRLARFLVLGSEGGSYYATERDLTSENVACLAECDPYKAIDLIVEISEDGRAPKNDPALFALAYYAGKGNTRPSAEDVKVRQYALDRLPRVARIGTHLFHFAEFVEKQRGWGRGLRRGIAAWYENEDVSKVAYQAVKYRQRDAWTHRDLLRLAHPEAPTPQHKALYDWIAHPDKYSGLASERIADEKLRIVEGFVKAQAATTPKDSARLIGEFNLPREAVNTDHLTSPEVWEALLYAGRKTVDWVPEEIVAQYGGMENVPDDVPREKKIVGGMPLGALIRNLPTMTRAGIIGPMSSHNAEIARRITDADGLKRARVHPLQVLTSHITYQSGQSIRGSSTWTPQSAIVDALNDGFYEAFSAVESTGKRILLALDVSSSMSGNYVNGVPGLTPRIASAAMALVTANVEPNHYFVAFTHEIVPIEISPRERLDAVVRKLSNLPFGGTDCSLPMLWASGAKLKRTGRYGYSSGGRYGEEVNVTEGKTTVPVDAFIVYTDNETWHGGIHPSQALQHYREKTSIEARSVVVGMVSNGFTIADPNDAGMLDVVGFDSAAPAVISDFVAGKI